MKYFLYQLQFDTPIHFGNAEEGGKLEQSGMTYRADTLFSALCYELAAATDNIGIQHLYKQAQTGALLFSDLFPYYVDEKDCSFYIPKPVLSVEWNERSVNGYDSIRKDATMQKRIKKRTFIQISQLGSYLEALKSGKMMSWDMPILGHSELMVRVNCTEEESRPYYVNQFTFTDKAGLYGIVAYEYDEDRKWICGVLQNIGLSGIGGKRSSGYGKFHFFDDPIDLDSIGIYKDDSVLYDMLTNENALRYMNISIVLPNATDVDIVKKGQYVICKRSGFIMPDGVSKTVKKNDVYMLQAGSCFPEKIKGMITSVSDTLNHPVWRYGKGLYVGLMV